MYSSIAFLSSSMLYIFFQRCDIIVIESLFLENGVETLNDGVIQRIAFFGMRYDNSVWFADHTKHSWKILKPFIWMEYQPIQIFCLSDVLIPKTSHMVLIWYLRLYRVMNAFFTHNWPPYVILDFLWCHTAPWKQWFLLSLVFLSCWHLLRHSVYRRASISWRSYYLLHTSRLDSVMTCFPQVILSILLTFSSTILFQLFAFNLPFSLLFCR